MSASLYASVGRTARQLINKFGKRMIYRQKKDGQVYNDQTMRYEPSIKDTPFKGIRKNAKIEENPELPIQLGDSPCPPSPTRSSWTAKHGASWTPHPWPRGIRHWSTTS